MQEFELQPGDSLFAFTDGVTEAMGDTGDFGEAALMQGIATAGPQAANYIESIQSRMAIHVGSHYPHDDITMLCVVRTAS